MILQFFKHKLCSSNLENHNQKRKHCKKKHIHEKKHAQSLKNFTNEELFVHSNDLDKNTLGGEGSKSGCDVLEVYYSSIYDAIHRAPTKELFILKNFLTLSFARQNVVKNKSEGWM